MAGIVTKVSPGPALGSNPNAKTVGITMRPPKRAAMMERPATHAVDVRRFVFSER